MRNPVSSKPGARTTRPRAAREVEFKLALGTVGNDAVLRHPAVRALKVDRAVRVRLVDRYFDTPDFALARDGLALRTRQCRGQWVQTLKADGRAAGGLAIRSEYQWPVASSEPDWRRLAGTPWAMSLRAARGALIAVFGAESTRTATTLVFPDGTCVGLTLDRGVLTARAGTSAIAELELELQRGSLTSVFPLVRRLMLDLGLSVEPRSKAARGLALAGRPPPPAALPVRLSPGSNPALAELARIGGVALATLGHEVERARRQRDPEHVHQVRVGLRRLRLICWAADLGAEVAHFAELEQRIHSAYRELGAARDWSVISGEVLGRGGLPDGDEVLERWRARAQRHSARSARQASRWLGEAPFQELLVHAAQSLHAMEKAGRSRSCRWLTRELGRRAIQADSRLRSRLEKLVRARRGDPRRQHEARRLARRLRDRLALVTPSAQPSAASERYHRRLNELQAALGRLNDWNNASAALAGPGSGEAGIPPWLTEQSGLAFESMVRAARRFLALPALADAPT